MNTPTPRTSAAIIASGFQAVPEGFRAFADNLERELTALTAERDHWQKIAAAASREREHNANVAQAMSAERDQLRARAERAEAEVERLKPYVSKAILTTEGTMLCSSQVAVKYNAAIARADRAEAELAAERARLDAVISNSWLVYHCSDSSFAVFSNICADYVSPWLATKRAAIDAAMKEGAK